MMKKVEFGGVVALSPDSDFETTHKPLVEQASVRDIRLKAVQAGLDYQIALADLELAIGAPLP